jgi:hypothetical protein
MGIQKNNTIMFSKMENKHIEEQAHLLQQPRRMYLIFCLWYYVVTTVNLYAI